MVPENTQNGYPAQATCQQFVEPNRFNVPQEYEKKKRGIRCLLFHCSGPEKTRTNNSSIDTHACAVGINRRVCFACAFFEFLRFKEYKNKRVAEAFQYISKRPFRLG